jgi:DNA polymerase-3 subunit gamma/tau
VFIIDECHAISNTGWQAFLKLIEEPPAKSIFIFCTTNPERIPRTILSRVQRYDFKKISQDGIVKRLMHILIKEDLVESYSAEALEYIAKLAEGGMRDAITMLDKCLSFSKDVTVDNVVKALGVANYGSMIAVTSAFVYGEANNLIVALERIHSDGVDMKQFIRQYLNFVLDIKKWFILGDFKFLQIPEIDTIKDFINDLDDTDNWSKIWDRICDLLDIVIKINSAVKYDSNPKYLIEAMLLEGIK